MIEAGQIGSDLELMKAVNLACTPGMCLDMVEDYCRHRAQARGWKWD
jgi:hypothetical protein